MPLSQNGKMPYVPAVLCGLACVAMDRFGLFPLLFLTPLGFSALVYGAPVAWIALAIAAVCNAVLALAFSASETPAGIGMDILRFTVLAVGFTWVMAGNPRRSFFAWLAPGDSAAQLPYVRTVYRFVAASGAAALVFIGTVFRFGREGFSHLAKQLEPVVPELIDATAGGDAAMKSYMEHALTPDRLVEMFASVTLRGGALFSAMFLLFFSRQVSFLAARLFLKGRMGSTGLAGFFAPQRAVPVLSCSILAVLLGRTLSIAFVEIVAWNLLVMCCIMFMAQGAGIVMFNIAHRKLTAMVRVAVGILVAVLLLSPGINLVALAALLVLGIAENWLPMRAPKTEMPS